MPRDFVVYIRTRVLYPLCTVIAVAATMVGAVAQEDSVPTATATGAAQPFAREVLAVTSTHFKDRDAGPGGQVHSLLQLPLNHLGMTVRIHPLASGEPTDVNPAVTRAVLLYLDGDEPSLPRWLWPWLERQRLTPGVKFVHMGSLRALHEQTPEALQRWLLGLGLTPPAVQMDNPLRVFWKAPDTARYGFEELPTLLEHSAPSLIADAPAAQGAAVWLETSDRKNPTDRRHPILTTTWGGLALNPWTLTYGTGNGDRRWHIDPIEFFRTALGLHDAPALDPNVTVGRRMFLLHVDGDGFESLSTAGSARGDTLPVSGQVFEDQVVKRFRIPMTLSIVVASLTDDLEPQTVTGEMEIARRIFATPWVEPASHTVLHPLNWRRTLTPRSLPRSVVWYQRLANYEHSMVAEVKDSVRFINRHLAPKDKPCAVLLWSGVANPDEQTVAAAAEVDCVNLNGGVYRWDAAFDSMGYVVPWGLQQGNTFQVYCGAANENVFDGFYTDVPTAFAHIHETLENTGSPRILKPANVYAHFYSVEHKARLRSLLQLVQEWCYRRPTVPVFASTYAGAVADAQGRGRVTKLADDGWHFADLGRCNTVRWDHPKGFVDWARSPGVVGANTIQGALYLQLSPDGAKLRWSSNPVVGHPYLVEADHVLTELTRTADRIAWRSHAWQDRKVTIGGLGSRQSVEVTIDGSTHTQRADGDGLLEVLLPGSGNQAVEVKTP